MAGLILEITGRHEHHYVPIDKPLLRVGRALDNDVILNDATLSPHHFVIKQTPEHGYMLYPLSDENGIRLGRETLDEPIGLDGKAVTLNAGRTRFRVLPRDFPVESTRMMGCQSGAICLFGSALAAWVLFFAFLSTSVVDNYLSTPERLDWESFGRDQMIIVLAVLAITAGLTLLIRLTAQRWELTSSLAFVSLMLLLATLLDQATVFLDYFFTTSVFGISADLGWSIFLAPLALVWFLVRVNHSNIASSVVIVLALLTPAAYFQSKQAISYFGLFDTFSKKAHYPNEIYPFDTRAQESVAIDRYIQEMQKTFSDNR